METGSAARTNGTAVNQEDVKSPSSPKQNGEETKKSTSPSRAQETVKSTGGSSLETGQVKSSLFPGGEWKRPIIQLLAVWGPEEAVSPFCRDRRPEETQLQPARARGRVKAQGEAGRCPVRLLHRQQAEGREVLPGVPGVLL
uniref:Uncharacterized protein n=1 Tax=Crocodylus porosus TaxID=8502 RepID=A0A7M4E774_CROPO